jgi:hypothetical protein
MDCDGICDTLRKRHPAQRDLIKPEIEGGRGAFIPPPNLRGPARGMCA